MISFIRPLPSGTAIQVVLAPPVGALSWRLLRKTMDDFSGESDVHAVRVVDTQHDKSIVDDLGVINGQAYYYRAYYWNGSVWSASRTGSAIASQSFIGIGTDALMYVRQRVDDGLRSMVAQGILQHPRNHIPVLAGMPSIDDVAFPVVTVTLQHESQQDRFIGEEFDNGEFDAESDTWAESFGWLSRVQINVIGWTFNVEERNTLRRALRSLILVNLPVFDAAGLQQVEFSQQDVDDAQSYNAPIYETVGLFSCLAAAAVAVNEDAIKEVQVALTALAPNGKRIVYPRTFPGSF